MSEAAMAAEEMFRVTLSGITYTFRIVEAIISGAVHVNQASNRTAMMGFLAPFENQVPANEGQVKVEQMLRRGKGLAQFNLREQDYATFTAAAKESGLTYATVEMDKVHPAGQRVLTIFVAFDDAHTVNNIFELNNLNAVKTSDFVKEVETPSTKSPSKEQDPAESIRQKNERFMAHFHGEDAQPVKQEEVNPMTPEGMNHEGPSVSGSGKSENETRQTSLSSKDEGVGRPSVRAKINAYREEQRSTALTQEERERIAQEYLESMKGGR